MRIIKAIITVFVLLVFAVIGVDLAFSQDEDMLEKMAADEELQQELKWLKAETYVITPSRIPEKIKKTAASISVVTDRRIRQMGARNLSDVLRTVVGMDTWYNPWGSHSITVRGMSGNNILTMINGHATYEPQNNGDILIYDTLIVDNIKRIEFLRSPGSAIYGANAYHGVVNVITKEAEDIDGFELTARGGTYDTQQYNLLFGKTFSDLEVAFNFNYFKTHGFRGLIEEDYQTQIDKLSAPLPPASLAPGRMAGNDEKYDAQLTLRYKRFKFDGRYFDREHDLPVGNLLALNEKTNSSPQYYILTLSYETSIWKGLDLFGKAYGNFFDSSFDAQFLPPGLVVRTPTPPGYAVMEDGMLFKSSHKSRRTGIEIQATYKTNDSNTVVSGATYEEQKVYDFSLSANYWRVPGTNYYITYPSLQEWPDEDIQDSEKRDFKAVFIEDIWDITQDLRLTAGVRYDHYSDFGGEVSPRAGLTWEYLEGYDLKLLYAHAFRAPNFFELYNVDSGNPDLDPETTDVYELSLGAEFTPSLSGRVTLWHREVEGPISTSTIFPPFIYGNYGEGTRHGLEIEMKYDFGRGTYLSGNYEYREIFDDLTLPDGGKFRNWIAPAHVGNIMANIRLSRYLNFFADCHFEDGFRRDYGDPRDDMSGYAIVNTTLIAKKFLKRYEGLELRGSVYNLFDKDYTSATPPRTTIAPLPALPNDLPMPVIHFLLEMKYKF